MSGLLHFALNVREMSGFPEIGVNHVRRCPVWAAPRSWNQESSRTASEYSN